MRDQVQDFMNVTETVLKEEVVNAANFLSRKIEAKELPR